MNRIVPRFWCRALCPLGSFLGVLSRFAIFGMEKDHVHLVIRYPPKVSISQLVKHLKGRSSQTGLPGASKKGSALWSSGYFAKSVSDQAMDETAGYARNQGMPEKQSKRTSRPVAKVVHAKPQHASG